MNRRDLFKYLAAAGAALVVPELWVPGEKKIFLPPTDGWTVVPDAGWSGAEWQTVAVFRCYAHGKWERLPDEQKQRWVHANGSAIVTQQIEFEEI
jgi:hypothetical protein